ncbi:MAG: YHS domain-containing (seleno)protein [Cyanobacteria bacterium P01_D01_bin.105]
MTAAVSVGLVACTSATPSAETTVSESSVATEAVADGEPAENVYLKDNLAIGGADPVAYFDDGLAAGEFVEGSADYTHEWKGVTWQFASAENRDAFAAEPEKYAPQYGGYCAWAAAQNQLAGISPGAWSVVDGKLYLNANKNIQARWEKDIPGFIAQADDNWPTLSVQ